MKVLKAYLLRDTIFPALTAIAIMLSLVWLMQSLRFLDLIINKGLGISTFLHLTVLLLPVLLFTILPLALFAGACYAFKRLNDDNELSSLFAAGISKWRLLQPAFFVAMLAVGIGYFLSLYAMPASMVDFKALQHKLRHSEGHLLLEVGTFNQLDKGLMVFLKKRNTPTSFEMLLVHDTRTPEKPVTWMAKSGRIFTTKEGFPRIKLFEGIRQEVTSTQISMLEFKEHTLDITKQLTPPPKRMRDREERFLYELTQYDGLMEKQVHQFKAEYHKRLLWPLTPIPLLFIAACLLLKDRHRRQGMIMPVMAAAGLAIMYYIFMMTLHNLASKGDTYILFGQWALPFFSTLTGIILLTRKRVS